MIVRYGIYHAHRPSPEKGVDHHAIIDFRNPLGLVRPGYAIVFEIVPTGLRARLLQPGEQWILTPIVEEQGARGRILRLWRSPERHSYDWLFNNCEHVARYIATGEFRSEQVRGGLVLVGAVLAVACLAQS